LAAFGGLLYLARPEITVPPSFRARPRALTLDPAITYLNHGSFGACPRPVLDAQQASRATRAQAAFFNREAPCAHRRAQGWRSS
jgi:hypothetical protein